MVEASRGGDRFETWLRHLEAQSADANNAYDGTAIVDFVRRFGGRSEFTTNLMPGSAGPDWLQVLNEPGWTSEEKVLLTVAAGLHTGSRVFRIRVITLLDLPDADLDLVLDAIRRCRRARDRARTLPDTHTAMQPDAL
ncbi:MAG: hypothetical protein ACXV5Q_11555 [Frankiaceae bacterium]